MRCESSRGGARVLRASLLRTTAPDRLRDKFLQLPAAPMYPVSVASNRTVTANTIYLDFIGCENKSADLYLDLSVHFCDQVELSWFWIEMAMEKKQDAGLVHYFLENKLFARPS